MQTFNDNPAGMNNEQVDIAKYLKVLKRYKWSIITLTILGTILGSLMVYSKTPLYRATCQLVFESQLPKLPSMEQMFGIQGQAQEYMATQHQVIRSRGVAEIVATKLSLYDIDDDPADVSEIIADAQQSTLIDWLKATFPVYQQQKQVVKLGLERRRAYAADELLTGLSVSPIGITKIINISYVSDNPAKAAKIANTFAEVYIDNKMNSRLEMTRDGSQWLFERMNILKQNLVTAERKLRSYIERQRLVQIGGGVAGLAEGKITAATSELSSARSEFAIISKRYGPKHPNYKAARSAVTRAASRLNEGKQEVRAINRKESQLRELRSQVASDQALYEVFLKRVKETDQSLGLDKAEARILDRALIPTRPFAPNINNFIVMSGVGSFIFTILLVFFGESLNRTIKGASEVEDKLGQVNLGILPIVSSLKRSRNVHFPVLDPNNASFAEAVRTIRTGIVLSGLDNPHKVILVTSSVPGEGKTTVASNLAVTLAQMERVLLIGGDLRRPSLNSVCGIEKGVAGLSELVAGNVDFKDAIIIDEQTGLNIMTCGMVPPNPLEILFSERFARVLEALEKYYDRIVIDSPPVNAVSDALVLSRFAKTVVYVVEADKTPEAVIKFGLKRLAHHDAPLAGIVLNKFNVKASDDYQGYYDKYGYSS